MRRGGFLFDLRGKDSGVIKAKAEGGQMWDWL